MLRPKGDKGSIPTAAIREDVDELTLREGEEGVQRTFINTAKAEASRRRSPLLDEDRHVVCQAIYIGVDGAALGGLVLQVREDKTKEVNVRSPGGSSRDKFLWKMSEARGRGDTYT